MILLGIIYLMFGLATCGLALTTDPWRTTFLALFDMANRTPPDLSPKANFAILLWVILWTWPVWFMGSGPDRFN